jgi:hypothetical protein
MEIDANAGDIAAIIFDAQKKRDDENAKAVSEAY